MTSGKRLRNLVRWIVPDGGEGPEAHEAGAERLLDKAEHELARLKRELDGVLPERDSGVCARSRH